MIPASMSVVRPVMDTKKLTALEKQIDAAEAWYVDVGRALNKMRQLFAMSDSFEAHCKRLWDWSKSTIYEKIRAAEIAVQVRKSAPIPRSASVALELWPVPEAERAAVWTDAVKHYGDRPTAHHIAKLVEAKIGRPHDALPGERSVEDVAGITTADLSSEAQRRFGNLTKADEEAQHEPRQHGGDGRADRIAAGTRKLKQAREIFAGLGGDEPEPILKAISRALLEAGRLEP